MEILPNGEYAYFLGDKQATNGCYVESVKIPLGETRPITHGTIISFGGLKDVTKPDGSSQRNPFRFRFSLGPALSFPSELPRRTRTMEELKEDCICPVCKEDMVDAHILPCTHSFCGACIWTWAQTRNTCPKCRSFFDAPIENRLLEDSLELATKSESLPKAVVEERKKRKIECVQERMRLKRMRPETTTTFANFRRNVARVVLYANMRSRFLEPVVAPPDRE
ncbi:hypothetical protein CYMTET_5548 [Cymbomonas tetramitiformis]|uniref:RING-type domain-containing protein n=1 Tax=Cymbomonas tetramitiformis TaxID=36881 RepID=A0AAE0GZ67_9CHLO|nr:hypothetical protein CYMTET_5548 [Cymbomonas tetramitiformis]